MVVFCTSVTGKQLRLSQTGRRASVNSYFLLWLHILNQIRFWGLSDAWICLIEIITLERCVYVQGSVSAFFFLQTCPVLSSIHLPINSLFLLKKDIAIAWDCCYYVTLKRRSAQADEVLVFHHKALCVQPRKFNFHFMWSVLIPLDVWCVPYIKLLQTLNWCQITFRFWFCHFSTKTKSVGCATCQQIAPPGQHTTFPHFI